MDIYNLADLAVCVLFSRKKRLIYRMYRCDSNIATHAHALNMVSDRDSLILRDRWRHNL